MSARDQNNTQFHVFMRLPPELRQMIWGFASPEPGVVAERDANDILKVVRYVRKVPAILHACQESRNFFLPEDEETARAHRQRGYPVYQRLFIAKRPIRAPKKRPYVFFCPEEDIMCLTVTQENDYELKDFLNVCDQDAALGIRCLGVPFTPFFESVIYWSQNSHRLEFGARLLKEWKTACPNLADIVFLMTDRCIANASQRNEALNAIERVIKTYTKDYSASPEDVPFPILTSLENFSIRFNVVVPKSAPCRRRSRKTAWFGY